MSLINYLLRFLGYNPDTRLVFKLDQEAVSALQRVADEEQRSIKEIAMDLLNSALSQRQAAVEQLRDWQALTPRQREVAALVCLNYTNNQIALRLGISTDTVKTHTRNILYKLGLSRKTELQQLLADWDFSAWDN
jgi:DNA-binding CsgD family transcriptional regulator